MELRSVLAESALFANLPPASLDALAALAAPINLRSGERLFTEDEPAEHLYIVATGRLRVMIRGQLAGLVAAHEPIGEIGLLSGEKRTATVEAIRDSQLIQIRRDQLMEFLVANPLALVAIARVLITRLRQNQRELKLNIARSARNFAVIPGTPGVDAAAVARALHERLCGMDTCRIVDDAAVNGELGESMSTTPMTDCAGNERLVEWLNQLERSFRYLVYTAGHEPDAWAARCMRQADRVLVVLNAGDTPATTPMLDALRRSGIFAKVELLILRPPGADGGAVTAWKSQAEARAHYFVRPGNVTDFAALSRQLTGRAIGLVLGGGGARGFAHLGLLRALEERGLTIDLAGGSSMGALISALVAMGYSSHEIVPVLRDTFVTHNYLNDYMFPRIALIKGRKFLRRLREIFGEQLIEHLRMPWFCVSTNLTRGTAMVHDAGPLETWIAASMAVPGIAPPVVYKGELLSDGAVANSLPTDIMQNLERGPIVASNVSTEGDIRAPGIEGPDPEGLLNWTGPGDPPGLRDILFRTATMTSESGTRARAANANLYLRMPVLGIGMFAWKRMDEIVDRGYAYAKEKLAESADTLLK
ncbi:MAG: patatin-like phospholipase family protein [Gammaproteobacteria bacterium]